MGLFRDAMICTFGSGAAAAGLIYALQANLLPAAMSVALAFVMAHPAGYIAASAVSGLVLGITYFGVIKPALGLA